MSAVLSGKKDHFIQIGNTRHRMTGEHHYLLSEINDANPYLTMEEILFQTSLEWARLAHSMGAMSLINARGRMVR